VLYLDRHGETEWNRAGRLQGSRDLPLNEAGRRQVAALAELFRSRSISAAFSSPLRRARETAELILAGRGVPLQILPDLAEMRCGAWEGLDAAQREHRYPQVVKEWSQDPWRAAIPGAEPLEEVYLRARRVLGAILQEHVGQSVILSGHGFLNRVILISLLGRPRDAFWELKQPNASCHVLRWDGAIPHRDLASSTFPPPDMSEILVGRRADA
jgi:broad specificity phosphatase PhoE